MCVFFQIKDIKHIEQDYCFDAWVMSPCVGHGKAGVAKGVKNGKVAYQIDTDDE